MTVTQTFRCLDFSVLSGRVSRLGNFAAALAKRHRESAAYYAEAQDFLGSVRAEGACPCNWYFTVLVQGATGAEVEDRATKVATQLKMLDGVVVGLAGVFEARCETALVSLARELAEADERHPATFEICLPTGIHSRDVVEFGIGVTGVAAGVVAVSDVVQCLLGGALGCRASRSDADVVRHLGLPNRPASSFAAVGR